MTYIDAALLIQAVLAVVILCGVLMVSALWQMRRDADRWHIVHSDHIEALRKRMEDQRNWIESRLESMKEQLYDHEQENERTPD